MESIENTFEKGWFTDANPNMQPKGTYVDGLNGLFTMIDGKDNVWRVTKGTQEQFTIKAGYVPRGYITSSKRFFILSTNGWNWEIGYNNYPTTDTSVYFPIYNKVGIQIGSNDIITGYYNEESGYIKRLYWTNDRTEPMVLNIKDLLEYSDVSSLTLGETYLVVNGWIDINGLVYPVGEAFYFADGILDYSSDLKLVLDTSVNMLPFRPEVNFRPMTYNSIIDGNLTTGIYYIGYRYGTDGYKTPISSLSGPFLITKENYGRKYSHSHYYVENTNVADGGEIGAETSKGLRFILNTSGQRYSTIEVIIFKMGSSGIIQNGIVYIKEDVPLYSFIVDITWYIPGDVTDVEYLVSAEDVTKVRDLIQAEKQAIIANIDVSSEIDLPNTIPNVSIFPIIRELPADVMGRMSPNNYVDYARYVGTYSTKSDGYILSEHVLVNQEYLVEGTETVSYNSISYAPGDVILGVAGINSFHPITAKLKPIYRIAKYLNRSITPIPLLEYETLETGEDLGYKGLSAAKLAGFWGNETYRIGVLPISKKGSFYHVRWIGDVQIPQRNTDYSFNSLSSNGTVTTDQHGKLVSIYDNSSEKSNPFDQVTNVRICGLVINNLDLTDVIDNISGFSIVIAPRDKTIIFEAAAEFSLYHREWIDGPNGGAGTWHYGEDTIYQRARFLSINNGIPLIHGDNTIQIDKSRIFLTSPDFDSNKSKYPITDDYSLILRGTAGEDHQPFPFNYVGIGLGTENYPEFYVEKFYHEGAGNDENYILDSITDITPFNSVEVDLKTNTIYGIIGNTYFENLSIYSSAQNSVSGIWPNEALSLFDWCNSGILLKINKDLDIWEENTDKSSIGIVQIKNKRTALYNGQNDTALAATYYQHIGHYQEITEAVKTDVETPEGKYIFDGIEIFGGDCYVSIYPVQRAVQYSDSPVLPGNFAPQHYGSVICVPLQSETNPLMRGGRTTLKDIRFFYKWMDQEGSWSHLDVTNSKSPINYKTEGIYYGKDFKEDTIEQIFPNDQMYLPANTIRFPGLPEDFKYETSLPYRGYYSNPKTNNEEEDNYRIFPVLNYFDMEGEDGEISNIRYNRNKLFVWQDTMLSYIPIDERALRANELGLPIQLGIAGRYERDDQILEFFGNQHQHGLAKVPGAYIWHDAIKKTSMLLQEDGKTMILSTKLGLDNIMNKMRITSDKDSIISAYDHSNRMLYMTFEYEYGDGVLWQTIGFDTKKMVYVGKFEFIPQLMVSHHNRMFCNINTNSIHRNNYGTDYKFFGTGYGAYITFYVGSTMDYIKRFISGVLRYEGTFFDEIQFSCFTDGENSEFENSFTDNSDNIQYDYKFMPNEARFGFPAEGSLGRFESFVLKVKLKITNVSGVTELYNLVSLINKMH